VVAGCFTPFDPRRGGKPPVSLNKLHIATVEDRDEWKRTNTILESRADFLTIHA